MHETLGPKKERVVTSENLPWKISALSPLGERGNRKAVGEGVKYWEPSA
jgi:hypothetical protein